MISTIKSLISTEWKRFVKYALVGGTARAVTGGAGGYLVMDALTKQIEADYIEKHLPEVLSIFRPVAVFIVQRIMSKVKSEGVESCAFQGALFGTMTGSSLGVTRIVVGIAYRTVKLISRRRPCCITLYRVKN